MGKAYWFVFCKSDILLKDNGDGTFDIPYGEKPPVDIKEWNHILNISPMNDGSLVKSVRIDSPVTESVKYVMCGLRASYYKLKKEFYLKAGKCHELLYWDDNTKFCGTCGTPMVMNTDISKKCPSCGKEIWPLLATAIIVLVHKGDKVLLVHAKNFKSDFYGLVAGFVETGETLEEAVRREVKEETGLEIKNIRYFGSQPWPYPCGLMVGFNADYNGGELHLQFTELEKGGWFTRNSLPTLPEKLSIARMIIDDWLANG